MKLGKAATYYNAANNIKRNISLFRVAKDILLEINYQRFVESYKYMMKMLYTGLILLMVIPAVIFIVLTGNIQTGLLGVASVIIFLPIWIIIVSKLPKSRIAQEFSKWHASGDSSLRALDHIFMIKKVGILNTVELVV